MVQNLSTFYKLFFQAFPDFQQLSLNPISFKSYRLIGNKKLSNRRVNYIENAGNCCWTIFENVHFKGLSQKIDLGYNGEPDFQLKSVKQSSC